MDLNGLSDPFVKIMFGNERKRTTVVRKNLNPVWNESFKFEVPSLMNDLISRELVIEVWDWDRVGRDDFIGQRIWILEQLSDGKPIEDWFEMKADRVDVESHVKILTALHQSSLRRRAREEEIMPSVLPYPSFSGESVLIERILCFFSRLTYSNSLFLTLVTAKYQIYDFLNATKY
jgi:hypothetical protein